MSWAEANVALHGHGKHKIAFAGYERVSEFLVQCEYVEWVHIN